MRCITVKRIFLYIVVAYAFTSGYVIARYIDQHAALAAIGVADSNLGIRRQ